MKIVHVCQYYNDGYGYQENLLPKYQAKLGHEVMVITSDRMSYFSGEKKPKIVGTGEFEDNGIRIVRLPIEREFKGRYVKFVNLIEVLEKENPDYIFHHDLTCPSLIEAAKYKQKHPSVFLVADNHSDYNNSGQNFLWRVFYYRMIWKRKLKYIKENIDLFFSLTPGCKLYAEQELGVPSDKHDLLYLGADVDNIHFSSEWRDYIRKGYGFNENDLVIITVGKIDERKKTDLVIKALKEIKSSNVRLLVVGTIKREYEKYLDEMIDSDKRIIKVGWVKAKDLYKYYSAADIAVFPGSQSAVWQQAISCELPLIIKYWPGTEYLLYKKNGFFLFSEDHRELKQHIESLILTPILIRNMREGSKIVTKEILSYDVISEQTIRTVF